MWRKPNRLLSNSKHPILMCPIQLSLKEVVPLHTDTCHTKKTMTMEELLIPFMRIRNPYYACAVDMKDTTKATACPVN